MRKLAGCAARARRTLATIPIANPLSATTRRAADAAPRHRARLATAPVVCLNDCSHGCIPAAVPWLRAQLSAAAQQHDKPNVSDKLINGIKDDPATKDVDESYAGFRDLAQAYRAENGLALDAMIPADAATRSASGLDPDISPANAEQQVARVAKARNLDAARVREIVEQNTSGRALFFTGEPRVNVLLTNLALDRLTAGDAADFRRVSGI